MEKKNHQNENSGSNRIGPSILDSTDYPTKYPPQIELLLDSSENCCPVKPDPIKPDNTKVNTLPIEYYLDSQNNQAPGKGKENGGGYPIQPKNEFHPIYPNDETEFVPKGLQNLGPRKPSYEETIKWMERQKNGE